MSKLASIFPSTMAYKNISELSTFAWINQIIYALEYCITRMYLCIWGFDTLSVIYITSQFD